MFCGRRHLRRESTLDPGCGLPGQGRQSSFWLIFDERVQKSAAAGFCTLYFGTYFTSAL
jgi:hypothetical protein